MDQNVITAWKKKETWNSRKTIEPLECNSLNSDKQEVHVTIEINVLVVYFSGPSLTVLL